MSVMEQVALKAQQRERCAAFFIAITAGCRSSTDVWVTGTPSWCHPCETTTGHNLSNPPTFIPSNFIGKNLEISEVT